MSLIDMAGGRKFIGFLLVALMFFVLTLTKTLPVETFVAFITANFGIYVVGNVSDTVASRNNTTPTVPPQS